VEKLTRFFRESREETEPGRMDDASNGTSVYDDYRNKGIYAQQSNTYVFIPRQPESRKIAAMLHGDRFRAS